jgi:uncharacterized membrane protein
MYDLYSPIMICSNCSAEMPEISAYCPACGQSVNPAPDPFRANDLMDKLLAAIAYVTIVPAAVFLFVPALRRRPFVRFHAWQVVLLVAATAGLALLLRLLFLIFSVLPFVGFLLAWLLVGVGAIAISILWAALVAKAVLGHRYEVPFVGPWAARLAQ